MFEYRFSGNGELSGHNLGNLMLKALDHLSVRPLEAINLVRSLLKVDAALIPMSEQPVDLMAHDHEGNHVYGEVNVDQLTDMPQELMLSPHVHATREALDAIAQADVILIGPGSFLTSLMPLLLLDDLTQALRRSSANMIYIGNLGRELSVAAAALTLKNKLELMEEKIGRRMIDALIIGPTVDASEVQDRVVIKQPLEATDIPYRHDRQLLRQALDQALIELGARG
jgi:uncharacterized cofD-like protein